MTQTITAPSATTHSPEPPVRGVVRLSNRELRFQRRMTLLFTVAPLAGVAVAVWKLWGTGISGLDLALLIGFYAFTGLGITIGFHRLFTHRSFRAAGSVRLALAVAGSMAVEGSVIGWCATHRRHHAFADRYGDPHSPHLARAAGLKGVALGLWHAHVGWFLDPDRSDPNEWTPDLVADAPIRWVDRAFPWLTAATFLLPALIGWAVTGRLGGAWSAFLWASLVRVFLLQHVTWSINSICHFYGKEAYRARDESRNVWPMAAISLGESWHNNHHAFPWSARLGLRPWQVDLGWYVIAAMRALRLVREVKVPTREQREARRIRQGESHGRR
ncbi:MAG: fatty acid desaturase [Actinomycetota bacterium]|nr:fatty acid desaturase [Actinomycetota bacterium]